jgi:hypothetical protein
MFQRGKAMEINIVPLVPEAVLPLIASAKTRPVVPSGYGIQEQCLPFTSAAALGLLVRSPISFGYCRTDEIPMESHGLRSPLKGDPRTCPDDELVFYVVDDPSCQFVRNTFHYVEGARAAANAPVFAPGLSFFDRDDQVDLFKLHLPYICRTDPEIDTLFLHPLNRTHPFDVMSGLVETDWYSSAIDLVLRPHGSTVHVAKGDILAQLVFIHRLQRHATVRVQADHSRLTRDVRSSMAQWLQHHAADRSAYKRLARSRHGEFHPSHEHKQSGPRKD